MFYKSENFFTQYLDVTSIDSRIEFFLQNIREKSVLHVGCADTLFFNPSINLHIKLKKEVDTIIGFDIDEHAVINLKKHCPGEYYTTYSDIKDKQFDVIIVPEVLEHIMNPDKFLEDIFKIKANKYIITVPNAFTYTKEMTYEGNIFKEIIHPDHKYWFTPYTLFNITKNYHTKKVSLYMLEKNSMVAIVIEKE
jgi:hypothetical protein